MKKLNGLEKLFKTNFASLILLIFGLGISGFAASPGALDPTFGTLGRVLRNVSVSTSGSDLVVQPDGKIVVGGIINAGAGGSGLGVVRFNANGSLDTTFGTNGAVIIDFGPDTEFGSRIALQADGKIIIAGSILVSPSPNRDIIVARLNTNGTLDTTFNSTGRLTFSVSSTELELLNDADIAPDGKIVLTVFLPGDYAVVRLNTNGSFDTTFNSNGIRLIDVNNTTNQVRRSAIQSDGKIVVTGVGVFSGLYRFSTVRLNTNGTNDNTFGTSGLNTVAFANENAMPSDLEIQSNGRIVITGRSYDASFNEKIAITRLNTNGTMDTTFGTGGRVELKIGNQSSENLGDLVIQPNDDKILTTYTGDGNRLLRFNANGSVDQSFGWNGSFQTPNWGASAIAFLADGKFVSVASQSSSILLTRHNNSTIPSSSSDFDGDGFSDFAIYRPSTANWFILRSSDNTTQILSFGASGDIPLDGDFDGDGRNDVAIYRPSVAQWWIQRSSNATVFATPFGLSSDKAVPGDYDKDGRTDVAIFRPSSGEWFVLRSSSGNTNFFGFQFGANGDIPINGKGF